MLPAVELQMARYWSGFFWYMIDHPDSDRAQKFRENLTDSEFVYAATMMATMYELSSQRIIRKYGLA